MLYGRKVRALSSGVGWEKQRMRLTALSFSRQELKREPGCPRHATVGCWKLRWGLVRCLSAGNMNGVFVWRFGSCQYSWCCVSIQKKKEKKSYVSIEKNIVSDSKIATKCLIFKNSSFNLMTYVPLNIITININLQEPWCIIDHLITFRYFLV